MTWMENNQMTSLVPRSHNTYDNQTRYISYTGSLENVFAHERSEALGTVGSPNSSVACALACATADA